MNGNVQMRSSSKYLYNTLRILSKSCISVAVAQKLLFIASVLHVCLFIFWALNKISNFTIIYLFPRE